MTARYSVGYTDPRGVFGTYKVFDIIEYGAEFEWKGFMKKKKVDTHVYRSEAKDLDIEVCKNLWLVKYGNEPVPETELAEQDQLIWECGNRLYWADMLEEVKTTDEFYRTYICKS